ncbi:malto-oligosyltrehalose trehalohydrolase [Oceanibaculum pacificum]|uniref:Malto-oligosyltrehalose trehalohydrolase n=1 Tax=Oceanibaculum pacificum TaxID=580166 RepID=A0A154WGV9_9PROT|nr:malto-oligosyltrehalose trehalohydrolase [Oceanibaculum pacificum]KZD12747.1 malto-oligosyltrehalose trehalohydrolase [Oceanibaculum pacificum]
MSGGFAFRKSWGAELFADGGARFRLWAPDAERLSLRLSGGADLPMQRTEMGWFEVQADGLTAGMEYGFVLPDGTCVPDPAARAQAGDVHGMSRLVDPTAYRWRTPDWRGRPWEETVIYELHVGAFSQTGDFDGVQRRLDYLARLGVTAVELMPVAQFSGERGWGYDGVLLYCPHRAYGGMEGLKRLVDAAHERGMMVFLDVVYNHFGPDGNYIHSYAPAFFDPKQHTPWGPTIRFEQPAVRSFFVENPLYWLEEYRLDGLRFDAIDQIADQADILILEEMAASIRQTFPNRHIHLATEDERNIVRLHPRDAENRPVLFTAEWNDDFHHAAHVTASGEEQGYYSDFAADPVGHLLRALTEGFAFQGEPYGPWDGKPRGVASNGQPPTAFVTFLQNHDQIGNRAFGERLTLLSDPRLLDILAAIHLLNPQVPLLYMGEEYGETRPFLFFTDFHGPLADAVREGRRREFAAFTAFSRDEIPDPNALSTFDSCRLDWGLADSAAGEARQNFYSRLLALRHHHIAPRLTDMLAMRATGQRLGERAFEVTWQLGDGALLRLLANLGERSISCPLAEEGATLLYGSGDGVLTSILGGSLPGYSLAVTLRKAPA